MQILMADTLQQQTTSDSFGASLKTVTQIILKYEKLDDTFSSNLFVKVETVKAVRP